VGQRFIIEMCWACIREVASNREEHVWTCRPTSGRSTARGALDSSNDFVIHLKRRILPERSPSKVLQRWCVVGARAMATAWSMQL
jgi:hypothetical protein